MLRLSPLFLLIAIFAASVADSQEPKTKTAAGKKEAPIVSPRTGESKTIELKADTGKASAAKN